MPTDNRLGRHVESFFHEYLIGQRGVSPNTVLSYRDTLKLFLQFTAEKHGKAVVRLRLEDLDVNAVLAFLDHLEAARKNSIATRNVRLAALHSFFRHVSAREPEALALCQRVVGIQPKRAPEPTVTYLERQEMEAVLHVVDNDSEIGRRDYALVSLAYQTGARAQELLELRAHDLQLTPPASVRLWGKGQKERILPLWDQTAARLTALLAERNVDPRSSELVFVNRRGQPLTRWGFRHLLRKYVASAASQGSTVSRKRVHPHTIRHTSAVHMLQAGVEPNAIRDTLGHASTDMTWRYARITLEMKRKAIESCPAPSTGKKSPVPRWHRHDLLAQLERLGRRDNYVKPVEPKP